MRFFFDNNLSIRIAKAIAELEDRDKNSVAHIREKYDQTMSDVESGRKEYYICTD